MTYINSQIRSDLEACIDHLALEIGERHHWAPKAYQRADRYISDSFEALGYTVNRYTYQLNSELLRSHGVSDANAVNIEAILEGQSKRSLVIGAHYDSIPNCPAANDNGSGVAAVIQLAKLLRDGPKLPFTVRFVCFANEECPWFHTAAMGSMVYARQLTESNHPVVAMWSLETMAYYSDEAKSQVYPKPLSLLYPDTGNFLAFVGNMSSRKLLKETLKGFRLQQDLPCQGAAVPEFMMGSTWSDHWSFGQFNIPALMITDTAPFRYEHYHTPQDTPDKLSFGAYTIAVQALYNTVLNLKLG